MNKNQLLPLVLLVSLILGVIVYREKNRCVESPTTNCRVNQLSFENIVQGQRFGEVEKILGDKNVIRPQNIAVKESCKQCDSIFLWDSDKYYQPNFKSIYVGFIDDTVAFKLYAQGQKK